MKTIIILFAFASCAFGSPKIDTHLSIKQIEDEYRCQFIGQFDAMFFYGKEAEWLFVKRSDTLGLKAYEFSVCQYPDDKQVCAAIISSITEARAIEKIFNLLNKQQNIINI